MLDWYKSTAQKLDASHCVIATFVIDENGNLWIADRHSEHIACAAEQPVLSAGEMTFCLKGTTVTVKEVSHQSLGYCPPPETWWAVSSALTKSAISHPADFTMKLHFRRCEGCGAKNIVKDDWFVCDVCQAGLSPAWNFDNMQA